MKNERGYIAIFEALIAIFLILTCTLFLNSLILGPNTSLSHKSDDFTNAQDIMQSLAGDVNFTDDSTLSKLSSILDGRWDKNKAIGEAEEFIEPKFKEFGLTENYKFVELNEYDGATIAGEGDFRSAENISQASRFYGKFCFRLYVW